MEVLRALADPVRLDIVQRLAVTGEGSCNALGEDLDVHQTTLSQHYRVLREAGVTWTTIQGRSRLVRLRRDDLDALFPGLLDSVPNGAGRTRPNARSWHPTREISRLRAITRCRRGRGVESGWHVGAGFGIISPGGQP
ncbi:metalloregulator ArsR/SmtB family transcription factor [Streptomyces sp. NBC_00572]|uniref:ArsR/SmtB family transcription factor n=1 Tax=Streptomyces sp. NBC_00572 TaxID=2903664 RepID=UPI002B1D7529|nr:metalloregulator ArsR/SmtB family transcription factor [Streptomyces sp. NBC_00572]